MTALEKYDRLEAVGHWSETKDTPQQEVIVSFGDASLQLTSTDDRPLAHWALLATRAIGTRGDATIWSPDPQHDETLAISDPEMNRAIRAISAELEPAPAKPAKLRWVLRLVGVFILLALISRAPPYIAYWATALTSPSRAETFSTQLTASLVQENGKACKNWQSVRDLNTLLATSFEQAPTVQVFTLKDPALFALPNGTIIIARDALNDEPVVVISRLALAIAGAQRSAGLEQALLELGPLAGLEYLITGGRRTELPLGSIMEITPVGKDYVMARNLLTFALWPTEVLQEMARQDGIGLSVDDQQPAPLLTRADPAWQSILRICDN